MGLTEAEIADIETKFKSEYANFRSMQKEPKGLWAGIVEPARQKVNAATTRLVQKCISGDLDNLDRELSGTAPNQSFNNLDFTISDLLTHEFSHLHYTFDVLNTNPNLRTMLKNVARHRIMSHRLAEYRFNEQKTQEREEFYDEAQSQLDKMGPFKKALDNARSLGVKI